MGMTDEERAALFKQRFELVCDVIEAKREDIRAACGKSMDADKLIRVSKTYLAEPSNDNVVIRSDPVSIVKTILQFGQIGIYPDLNLCYGYFTPYDGECKPAFGYKGLIHLALRDDAVASIDSQAVYQNPNDELTDDVYQPLLGTTPGIHHAPLYPERTDTQDAPITWVYAVAHLKEGPPKIEVMARTQIELIRSCSFMKNSAPWRRYWGQMARKTVIRRLMNYLDLSAEVAAMIAADASAEYEEADSTIDTGTEAVSVPSFTDRLSEKAKAYKEQTNES